MKELINFIKNNTLVRYSLWLIIIVELLSFTSMAVPYLNEACFIVIILASLVIALNRLDLALALVLIELIISSKGYLFSLELNGADLSIRIGLWLVIMSVYLSKSIIELISRRFAWPLEQSALAKPYLTLAFFIILGALVGLISGNEVNNVFFDLNAWLYLTYLLPIYTAFRQKQRIKELLPLLVLAISWLAIKTLILVYWFSHNLFSANPELYTWVRQTGVGEITDLASGFYRIFMQSHIFVAAALVMGWYYWLRGKNSMLLGLSLAGLSAVMITSLSRSLWLGLALAGLAALSLAIKQKIKLKEIMLRLLGLLGLSLAGLALLAGLVFFPLPPAKDASLIDSFKERANITDEAAAASRWQLLPKLQDKLKESPVLGQGYGTTITYKSSDPRLRESSADGLYTTYAFEWGWLDIWLKLGLLGLITYVYLLWRLIKLNWQADNLLNHSLVLIVILLLVVNFFTPYLNHPLGLGIIMLASLLGDRPLQKN